MKKPRYSQNFLVNQGVCRRIVELAALSPHDRVVEIGPGRGALTTRLIERVRELWLIELDAALIEPLRTAFGMHEHVQVIHADAMRYPFEQLPAPFTVVANLPYAVASPLLVRLLEARASIPRMVLMFQREVAERITAKPGGRQYGLLSILVQLYADVKLEFVVSPGSFRPPPRVQSAVISVTPLPRTRIPLDDEALFLRLVRRGFGQRRKTLRNSLRHGGTPLLTDAQTAALLEAAAIDPVRRPETLTLEEWGRLARSCGELGINIEGPGSRVRGPGK